MSDFDSDFNEIKEVKQNRSNYFVTLNSNKTPEDIDPKVFVEAFKQLYTKYLPLCIHYNDKSSKSEGWEKIDEVILHKACLEVGSTMKRVHIHFCITFVHRTNIRLEGPVLEKLMTKLSGIDKKIHVDLAYLRTNEDIDRAVNYTMKNMDLIEF